MGYTHYWYQQRDITEIEWDLIRTDASNILDGAGNTIAWEYDEPTRAPELSPELIRFNGIADQGCETFYLERQKAEKKDYVTAQSYAEDGAFNFCKTRNQPYDTYVTAILSAINQMAPTALCIASDGEKADWLGGVALANEKLKTSSIVIPEGVFE